MVRIRDGRRTRDGDGKEVLFGEMEVGFQPGDDVGKCDSAKLGRVGALVGEPVCVRMDGVLVGSGCGGWGEKEAEGEIHEEGQFTCRRVESWMEIDQIVGEG